MFVVIEIDDWSCVVECGFIVVIGIRIVGKIVIFFVGVGRMVGSFLVIVVGRLVVDWGIFGGFGGVGRMVGKGLDRICVVIVGVERLGVIWEGDSFGLIIIVVILVFFLEVYCGGVIVVNVRMKFVIVIFKLEFIIGV